jgi:FkbM family methyltransferase
MYYGQNLEDRLVSEWFGQYIGTLLEIGANDGMTYSNSLSLIRKGWNAVLVEPSMKVFPKLCQLHSKKENVILINAAIGNHNGAAKLFDSGDFLLKGTCSLLSTLKKEEIKRWGDVTFEEIDTIVITFEKLLEDNPYKRYQFISIDCEGFDLEVLRQIDLDAVDCRCICIEHNSYPNILNQMKEYIIPYGFKQIGYNAENIILAR